MGIVLISLVVILGGVFIAFLSTTRSNRESTNLEDFPTMSFDSQILYRPIRAIRRNILEILASSNDPANQAMAGSVTEEINSAHDRVVQALQTRDQLRKAIEGHSSAQKEADRMKSAREAAESASEKLSFTMAYEAKLNEIAEYERAKEIIKKIENEIELTRASLEELKAKIAVSHATQNATDRAEDLRTTLASLETMQSSVDEAQEMLRS